MFKQCWKAIEFLQSCPEYQVGTLEDGDESLKVTVKDLNTGDHMSYTVTEDDPEKLLQGLKPMRRQGK